MDSLHNPRIGGGNLIAISLLVLGIGAFFSAPRLMTAAAQSGSSSIAATRVDKCRIVGNGDKLVRGGYYYQPTQDGRAEWLSAGTLLCDLYGSSGEVYEGGYLQYTITTDPVGMNKTLMKRLANKENPDNNPELRPRRDVAVPIYQPPAEQQPPDTFTGEPNG
jgi:hypothetical protein